MSTIWHVIIKTQKTHEIKEDRVFTDSEEQAFDLATRLYPGEYSHMIDGSNGTYKLAYAYTNVDRQVKCVLSRED